MARIPQMRSFTAPFTSGRHISHPVANGRGVRDALGAMAEPIYNKIHDAYPRNWRRYGLFRDDLLVETPAVQEAIRRLPSRVRELRDMRMRRALDLSMRQSVLPKELQVKDGEDLEYLLPVLREVEREWAYRKAFRKE